MKQAKQNAKLILFFSISLILNACSQDDEAVPVSENTVEFNGKNHTFSVSYLHSSRLSDYASSGIKTHRSFSIDQADGSLELNSDGTFKSYGDSKIILFYTLAFPNLDATFPLGTFEFISREGDNQLGTSQLREKYEGKSFFSHAWCIYDTNGNGALDNEDDDKILKVTMGTIQISGPETRPKIEYDLLFVDGKKLKGSYVGGLTKL